MNSFSISSSLCGLGRLKPAGEKEVVELKPACCCAGQPEVVENLDKRELAGDIIEKESESFRGTAVLEELSEENILEPRVCEEAVDLILAASKDLLWPLDESVEPESYGPWPPWPLLPGLPHC